MQPEHLLDQSDLLLSLKRNGQPRQADKRRAVSTAYYAVFHHVLGTVADTFVGFHGTPWPIYTAVYRSIDHRRLKTTCELALGKAWTASPIDASLQAFSTRLIFLAELRTLADYDPSFRINLGQARDAVTAAREAITSFDGVGSEQKNLFLTLLAFPRRS